MLANFLNSIVRTVKPYGVLFLIASLLIQSGCATRSYLEQGRYGIVVNGKKIAEKDMTPGTGTAIGAGAGATVGGVMGAVAGVGVTAATFGLAAGAIPVLTLSGAAIGGSVGGAGGYISDYHKTGSGTYQYTVKLIGQNDTLTITQYDETQIPDNTKVRVFLENEHMKISQDLEDE